MADANYARFNSRLTKIDRQHRKLARGYVRLEERNGLLIPVAPRRSMRSFSIGPFLLIILGFIGFKAFLLTYLGPLTYADRVGKLANGNTGEQFGAWVMSADPATTWVASQITMLF